MTRPTKIQLRQSRKRRIRAKVRGTSLRPRLSVYRSLKGIIAQLIDDEAGKTLAYATTLEAKGKGKTKAKSKVAVNKESAKKLGDTIAKKAKEKKISTVVFDRGGYKYHGRIKELADAARAGGLQF